jgi:hypothetical protein
MAALHAFTETGFMGLDVALITNAETLEAG